MRGPEWPRGPFLFDVTACPRQCFPRRMGQDPCPAFDPFPGGFEVLDANGQSLAYVYSRETKDAANIAGVLTDDEARRMASNIAKLPELVGCRLSRAMQT